MHVHLLLSIEQDQYTYISNVLIMLIKLGGGGVLS